jgi:hypothetical protein
VLAGWWQQLAPANPQAVWVGHLLLHRVEALVWGSRLRPLDRFCRMVLQAVALEHGRTLAAVGEHLHLEPQVLRRVLHQLQREGLAQASAAGEWQPTVLGHHALQQGEYPAVCHERRGFTFVESGQPGRRPHFLSLAAAGSPWSAPEGWSFDMAALHACVRQPPEWKQRHGFPLDVDGVHDLGGPGPPPTDAAPALPEKGETNGEPGSSPPFPTPLSEPPLWRRVVIDRPERLLAVLVQRPEGMTGFPVRQDGWVLETQRPAFVLGTDWGEVLPELAEGLPPEAWRHTWLAWCQSRNMPAAEACAVEYVGHRLRVAAPRLLMDRLRSTRSEALRGEVWLLAGNGRIRPAVLVELHEVS